MPPLPSGTGKYAAHGPHYAALWLHYAALGPTALWQHNATLRQHNEALGRHIFRYPSGRGGILYHYYMGGPILLSKRWAASFTVSGRHTGNYAALGPS